MTEDEFWILARDFKPPSPFEDLSFEKQYQSRLKHVEEHRILDMQADLWRLEAQCRKTIADAVMGQRLAVPGTALAERVL